MFDFYSKIMEITSPSYALPTNILYIPDKLPKTIEYNVKVNFREAETGWFLDNSKLLVKDYSFVLVNSKNNLKYFLKKSSKPFTNVGYDFSFSFEVDMQSGEMASVDYLEFKIQDTTGVTSTCRFPIKLVYLKTTTKSFSYQSKDKVITESNLIDSRSSLGFASWSTVSKNTISNASKILEAFHKPLYNIPLKISQFLNMSFSVEHVGRSFSRILVDSRPQSILRILENSKEPLVESFQVLNTIKSLDIIQENLTTNLTRILFEPYSTNSSEFVELNNLLPTTLYTRLKDSSQYDSAVFRIKGLDSFENDCEESIEIRSDIWTKIQGKYSEIHSIEGVEVPYEIANFVDLQHDYYVDSNPYIVPTTIRGRLLQTFKPLLIKKSNLSQDRDVLVIKDGSYDNSVEVYRYSFDSEKISSMFLTEDLDLLYTSVKDNQTYLNCCKLGIDHSKKIGDKTVNNNPYINVSEKRPFLGDWVDVVVNLKDWYLKVNTKAFMIQLKNQDAVYYYDPDTGSLTPEKTYIYTDIHNIEDLMEFSLYVENDQSYIITVYNGSQTESCSAQAQAEVLKPYKSVLLNKQSVLTLVNNSLCLTNTQYVEDDLTVTQKDPTDLLIILEVYGRTQLDYRLDIGGYYISTNGSNLSTDYYENISSNSLSSKIILKLKKEALTLLNYDLNNEKVFGIGCTYNKDFSTNVGKTYLTIVDNDNQLKLELLPKLIDGVENSVHEYTINIKQDSIDYERNVDYDL